MSATVGHPSDDLAAEPLRLAGAQPGFFRGTRTSIVAILQHRELLGLLVKRELKARYKDSILGFFWSLMRPLTLLAVYYVAIGHFLHAADATPDFAIFVFTGLTAWGVFSEILTGTTSSIIANAGLVKKVYLPREIFPLSVVGSSLVNFAIQLSILVVATATIGTFPLGARWLYLPLSLAVLVIWATSIGLVLSAVNVYLRDVQYLVEISIMVLMWASPIVYTWSQVSPSVAGTIWERLYLANPITLGVMGFQQTFWVAGPPSATPSDLPGRLAVAGALGLVAFWLAQRAFARLQSNFAQEL